MNKTSEYRFTIIVPLYDEEDNMSRLESRLSSYLPNCTCKACVLFVNDGSTDRTQQLLEEICSRHPDFLYLSFKENRGLSAAIKAGFDHCFSEYVGYIDGDLQTDPEDFNLLLAHIGSCQMVTGIRAERKDTIFKKMQSKIANGFRRMMTHDRALDTGCPLKVFRTSTAKRIPLFKGMHRFFPALVLLQEGADYRQIPVRHHPRQAGKSKFSMWNRLLGPFADCFAYRWMKTRFINYNVGQSNL